MAAREKKLVLISVAVLASTVVIIAWKSIYHAEPLHDAKPLTAWVEQWATNQRFFNAEAAAAHQEAQLAIRASASHGIAFLLDLMRVNDSVLKPRLQKLVPAAWHQKLHLIDEARKTRRLGVNGLAALGTNAASAVSELIEIAKNHSNEDGRFLAVSALKACGSAAEPALPFLVQCLTNDAGAIRLEARLALANFPNRADVVVPALIKHTEDLRAGLRHSETADAIFALGQFRQDAKAAAPVLVSLLKDSDLRVRAAAAIWLPYIDPEAAEKAGLSRP